MPELRLNKHELSVLRAIMVAATRKACPWLNHEGVAQKLGLPIGTARHHYYGVVRPARIYADVIANGTDLLAECLRVADVAATEVVVAQLRQAVRDARHAHLRRTAPSTLRSEERRLHGR